jgi:hypothetical protein
MISHRFSLFRVILAVACLAGYVLAACPSPQYQTPQGSCVQTCPSGTRQDNFFRVCIACSPVSQAIELSALWIDADNTQGTYNPSSGSSGCLSCNAGTYSPSPGASYCFTCNGGTYSGSGSPFCLPCNAVSLPVPTPAPTHL